MKNNTTLFTLAIALLAVLAFSACERNDRLANKLSSGTGIWNIDEIQHIHYDTTGAVSVDTSQHDAGEIVFFDSETLSALYDYNACTVGTIGTDGHYTAYPCEYYIDGDRFDIHDGPGFITHLYTVIKWTSRKLVIQYIEANNSSAGVSDLSYKMIITLKKK